MTVSNVTQASADIPIGIVTAKGDIIAATGSGAVTNVSVGSNNTVLVANSSATAGVNWSSTLSGLTLTSPTIGTITNTGTLTLPTSTDTLVGRATTDTLTNKTLTTPAINGGIFAYPLEAWYINATAFAGYTAYLQTNNAVHYLTSNSTSNGTLNITYASGTTLNSVMATGQAITFSLLITNSTAYYPNAFQVDGSAVTPKWSGGTAPSAGNASATDVYQFTLLKTASATWTVFAAGPVKYV
jgi:hypothetical protein